ncbi:response regulator with CheY-like receiver domain and winged-helix DNA-binding domain [Xenococcus sp. PCC 7305]|uniref:response regulator transcription factor n=1 Tax=Xenococcus sp. PCC 7305 TaxID=102125 RepID=UPI0002AC3CAD|nr:response regulator transcription factor [Xenococcus sp. PCC 7305]ELS05574.1 response regulator with CheY-like receiver domain and winged-helix DNA-binding domain [Xenococcus sp. PCC 7305]
MYLIDKEYQVVEKTQKKILVVDDDPALQNLICRFFKYNNYATESAFDGKNARQQLIRFKPDLVILDVNLPDDTGLNLCQEMKTNQTLVVMLTSMNDTNYVLEAFAKGADDYITKPFNLQILKAKIDALFRRVSTSTPSYFNKNKPLILNQLKIDFCRREVISDGEIIALTALEFDLLHFLATNPNRVWDRGELISAIWNRDNYTGEDRKVDIHIGRIRKKIGDQEGKLIKTIWGRGYMFEMSNQNQVQLAN